MAIRNLNYDVLVVGSGASGAAVSWFLSKSGNLRIACMEQGKFTSILDYPTNFPDWENRSSKDFSFRANDRKSWSDYEIDDSNSPIKIANFNAVGGSTILFSGHFPRFHESDFKTKDIDGVGQNWPISYDNLKPYYDLNDSITGVAGLVGDPAYPNITSNLLPPIPLGKLGERVASGMNKLSWHWWPSYSAINTDHRNPRPTCINLGPCNSGCSQGAKSSADVTYWPLALRNGVNLFSSTRVHELIFDKNQERVIGVRFVTDKGETGVVNAKIIVIACNGIGTPRLLLANKTKKFPNGVGNTNGLLGRNLMLHPLAYLEGTVTEDIMSSVGPQGCCLQSQEFYESQPHKTFKRGFTIQVLRSSGPLETARKGLRTRRIQLGPDFHKQFAKYFNRTISLSMITEDLPEESNTVTITPKTDSTGLPIPKINYKLSKNTKEILKFALAKGRELFKELDVKETIGFAPVSFAGWHLMGTARMGDDPEGSITNKFGQVHEVENLYIADSSLFVTSGAANPASTIQALALLIADQIAKKLGDK